MFPCNQKQAREEGGPEERRQPGFQDRVLAPGPHSPVLRLLPPTARMSSAPLREPPEVLREGVGCESSLETEASTPHSGVSIIPCDSVPLCPAPSSRLPSPRIKTSCRHCSDPGQSWHGAWRCCSAARPTLYPRHCHKATGALVSARVSDAPAPRTDSQPPQGACDEITAAWQGPATGGSVLGWDPVGLLVWLEVKQVFASGVP